VEKKGGGGIKLDVKFRPHKGTKLQFKFVGIYAMFLGLGFATFRMIVMHLSSE